MYLHIYRASQNFRLNRHVLIERINPSRKVFYYFAIRAIIHEIINDKRLANPRIGQARGEKRPSSIAWLLGVRQSVERDALLAMCDA